MEEFLQVEWDITEDELIDSSKNNISDIRYVYYESESGVLKSISNIQEENNLPFIFVPFRDVKNLIEGNELFSNYKVVFSPDEKDFILIKIEQEQELLESIHDVIFQIPFIVDTSNPIVIDPNNDITFIQDYENTCWKILINGELARTLKGKRIYFDKTYEIYVTALNDPNILYKTLTIQLNELLENYYVIFPFDDIDKDEIRISLYCKKFFSKYQYIKTKL